MYLQVWVRHENEKDDWFFAGVFSNAPAKPEVGELLDIAGDGAHETVESVIHNLKEKRLDVACSCTPQTAAHYLMDWNNWRIGYREQFQKDEALIRKTIEEMFEDADVVFTFKDPDS